MVLDWIFAEKKVFFALSTKVCNFLFNGIVIFLMDGEFRFDPTSLCLPTFPFQLAELLRDRTKVIIVVGDRALW